MVPTLVIPPRTGTVAADDPVTTDPPAVASVALTVSARCSVGTPAIENLPSAAVVAECPTTLTVAPATGCWLWLSSRPVTVVNGSGTMLICTLDPIPVLFPRSVADTSNVSDETPTGAVTLNSYGLLV